MADTITYSQSARLASETALQGTGTIDVDNCQVIQEAVPGAATDQVLSVLAFTKTKLKFLFLLSDQDITVKFTDISTGTTITLVADVPYMWCYDSGITNPLANNCTGATATNAGATPADDAVLDIRIGTDS